ncbi:protein 60A [Amyelois transitella]|uniref:protein 60A n=1 Tax=Amyelois transitella TaxID=680683 RepID=UPI00067D4C8F|nr:protein 60A [Amyelois transitella]
MTDPKAAWRCACITLVALFPLVCKATLSGLYIDNGVDQTVIHHSMTRHERLVVEHEILDLLGLGERPRGPRAPPLDRSAPSFLLDVYKQLAEEHEQARPTRSSEMALSGDEQIAIDASDLIMTFQSKKHHLGALRQGHGRHVWFEVAGAPGDASSLLTAELRLHQAPTHTEDPTSLYRVVAHRVINVDNLGKMQLEEVAAVNTSAGAEGWLELNVTNALGAWLSSPADNRGFFITLHPHSQPERHVKPEEIGLEEPRGAVVEGKQPFLVAFFKGGPKLGNADPGARRKREAKRWRSHGFSENHLRNPLTDTSHWTTRSCEIQTLYVSFKDLEWQDWIIAPDGYGAFYCSGECNFPLNAHKNATNHAIVQTLVHLLNPQQVPKPSCAPIKLSPISVLYYTDDSNVILRKYKNMVVKSCGCH